MKEVSMSKFDSKDHVLIATLTEAHNKCYLEDHLTIQKVWDSIMGLDTMPSTDQVCEWKLFKVGHPGKPVMDDIHENWTSQLTQFGALTSAPFPKFKPLEGWDVVLTLELLEKKSLHCPNPLARRC